MREDVGHPSWEEAGMTDPFTPPTGDQPPPVPSYGAPTGHPAPAPDVPLYGAPLTGPPRNGYGVAALVLGIASIVTFWSFVGGVLFGVLGLVFGILGRRRAKRGEATNGGVALAGLITGAVGLAVTAVYILAIVVFLNSGTGHRLRDCLDKAGSDQTKISQCQVQFQHDLQS